jgi:hypothetical protein
MVGVHSIDEGAVVAITGPGVEGEGVGNSEGVDVGPDVTYPFI